MAFVVLLWVAACTVAITRLTHGAEKWDPALAATYLDGRQEAWSTWKPAQSPDGPCISCHTGMPYLLARPALRRVLHESAPTTYEKNLIARLESKAGSKPAGNLQRVETIFAAMFATDADARAKTFEQLWALQIADGALKGGWQWYDAKLDPWETSDQFRYGAALAAIAIGSTHVPGGDVDRVRALAAYLQDGAPSRPLHVRLAMLWASAQLPDAMTPAVRQTTIDEVLKKQQADGGWSLDALGPWQPHAAAPASLDLRRSDSYATAFTAFVLKIAGGKSARKPAERALEWLRTHQDRRTGAWPAVSMNKVYPAGSMEEKFLQDAATSFAVLALTSR